MTSGWVCHICSEFLFEVFAASAQLWTTTQYFGLLCSPLSFQTWSCEQSKMENIRPRSAIEAFPELLYRRLLSGCVNILMNPELTWIPARLFSIPTAFKLGFYQNLNESQFCCLCLQILACTVKMQLSPNTHHAYMCWIRRNVNPKNLLHNFRVFLGWFFFFAKVHQKCLKHVL